jgi:hypothetical protein
MTAVHMTFSHQISDSDRQNPACQGEVTRRKKASAPAAWTIAAINKRVSRCSV